MRQKNERVGKYWKHDHPLFDGYQIDPQAIKPFKGQHPAIANNWLKNEAEQNFTPNKNHELTKREKKHRWAMKIERFFNYEFSKSHFKKENIKK
jgi:hypothetical protein